VPGDEEIGKRPIVDEVEGFARMFGADGVVERFFGNDVAFGGDA
jgi:hypothetical protein